MGKLFNIQQYVWVFVAILCHPGFAVIPIRSCVEGLLKLDGPRYPRIKKDRPNFPSGAQNEEFIEQVSGRLNAGSMFFHVESAYLKRLNDVVIRDKNVTGALEALYTERFFENLWRSIALNPFLKPHLIYSDYKTVRLKVRELHSELLDLLEKVHNQTNAQFAKDVRAQFPWLMDELRNSGVDIADPATWHLAGFGRTPDEAAIYAKFNRRMKAEGHQRVNDGTTFGSRDLIRLMVPIAELDRITVMSGFEKLLGRESQIFEVIDTPRPFRVLSTEFIELVKPHIFESESEFTRQVIDKMNRRFKFGAKGISVSSLASLFRHLRNYMQMVDLFVPSIYEKSEVLDLGFSMGHQGLMTVDISQQGARNYQHTMIALLRAQAELGTWMARPSLERVLELAREEQTRASQALLNERSFLNLVLHNSQIEGHFDFSGDDGTFLPERRMTEHSKRRFITLLAQSSRTPSRYRVVFVEPNIRNTRILLPESIRASFVTIGENIEKNLRKALEGKGFTHSQLSQITIGVDIRATALNSGVVSILLGGPEIPGLTAAIDRRLRSMIGADFSVSRVRYANLTPSLAE